MKAKRTLAILLTLCMAFTLLPGMCLFASAADEEVDAVSGATCTRAQAVSSLYVLAGEPAFMNDNIFSDVPSGSDAEKAIVWAQGKGIINGYGDGKFGPDDTMTKEQFFTMLYRYAQYQELDVSVGEDTNILSYEDAFDISEYAIPAIQWACGANLLGDNAGYLYPMDGFNAYALDNMISEFVVYYGIEPGAGPVGAVAGGWTVNTEFGTAAIPAEAQEAFDKAVSGLMGAKHEPVAYLGSQVVAGVNYAFLCKTTLVTAEPVTKLTVVKVYKDLEGNASVLDIKDVNITDYCEPNDIVYNASAGGWKANTETVAVLPENVQAAFDKATEGLLGVNYKPLAYLGSQVVAGANYAVLCSAQTVAPHSDAVSALVVAVIYADLSGGAKITSMANFPIA